MGTHYRGKRQWQIAVGTIPYVPHLVTRGPGGQMTTSVISRPTLNMVSNVKKDKY